MMLFLIQLNYNRSERSVFRWSPDWDGAASKYEKAAIAYKNLGKENKAVDCYVSAGRYNYLQDHHIRDNNILLQQMLLQSQIPMIVLVPTNHDDDD